MNKARLVIMLTVLVDVLGLGIVIPVLPFYILNLGIRSATILGFHLQLTELITVLFSIFSLLGFLSAPILGALSDKLGRRPILIISLAGTSIGWYIFGSALPLSKFLLAHNLNFGVTLSSLVVTLLFLGRFIDGITAGNFSSAQSYLIDIAKDAKDRASAFGVIGAIFGIGFIFGPLIGGQLAEPTSLLGHFLSTAGLSSLSSHFGLSTPFLVTAVLATLNTLSAIFFLPESHHAQHRTNAVKLNPFSPIIKAIKHPILAPVFLAWFLFGIAFTATFQGPIFSLFTQAKFHWTPNNVSLSLTLVGVLSALNQGFLIRRFWLKRFNATQLEIPTYIISGIIFVLMGFLNVVGFIVMLAASSLVTGLSRVITTNQISEHTQPHERGEILGTTQGLILLAASFSPTIAGKLLDINLSLPFYAASLLSLAGGGIIAWNYRRLEKVST